MRTYMKLGIRGKREAGQVCVLLICSLDRNDLIPGRL